MTLRLHTTAFAVALAVSSAAAQAALVTGQLASDDAELFLVAFDPSTNNTFVKDLGFTFSTLAANSANTSWFPATGIDLGALVNPGSGAGKFNFGTGVLWNLAAAKVKPSGAGTSANNGVFATVDLANTSASNLVLRGPGVSLNTANNRLNALRTPTTQKAGLLNGGFAAGAENTLLSADGNSFVVSSPTLDWAFEPGWGQLFNNQSPIDSTGEIGVTESLAFYHWYLDGSGQSTTVQSDVQAGAFRLSQAGLLTYTPVPLPAAVWLFAPTLATLTLARRRS